MEKIPSHVPCVCVITGVKHNKSQKNHISGKDLERLSSTFSCPKAWSTLPKPSVIDVQLTES